MRCREMIKELLEKIIKIVGEIVAEKYFAEFSYSYFGDVVEMIFYDGAYVNTVTINIKVFENNTIPYCVTVVFNALFDKECCETRKISDEEEKVVYALMNTVIFDNGFWIDFKNGLLNVYVGDDEEMTEIDLKDIELIKLIEEDIDNDLYIEFKDNYGGDKYIITGCEGYAWVQVKMEEFDKDKYIKELEEKVNKQSKLIELLRENQEKLMKMNKLI